MQAAKKGKGQEAGGARAEIAAPRAPAQPARILAQSARHRVEYENSGDWEYGGADEEFGGGCLTTGAAATTVGGGHPALASVGARRHARDSWLRKAGGVGAADDLVV